MAEDACLNVRVTVEVCQRPGLHADLAFTRALLDLVDHWKQAEKEERLSIVDVIRALSTEEEE